MHLALETFPTADIDIVEALHLIVQTEGEGMEGFQLRFTHELWVVPEILY
jgi:hypothetical protein